MYYTNTIVINSIFDFKTSSFLFQKRYKIIRAKFDKKNLKTDVVVVFE